MYKHWENQKRELFEIINNNKSSVCHVCYGTNYSIFFRNLHSDLLLKRSMLPVYIDLNHLKTHSIEHFHALLINSIKRSLLEKKLSGRVETEIPDVVSYLDKIKSILGSKPLSTLNISIFIEDLDLAPTLMDSIFAHMEHIKNVIPNISLIYISRTNVVHPRFSERLSKYTHLNDSVVYLPVRDDKTLRSIEKSLSRDAFNIVYAITGGIDKFHGVAMDLRNNLSLKERRNLHAHLSNNWHLKSEVKELWKTLSSSEVETLFNVVWGSKDIDKRYNHDLEHLLKLGILRKEKNQHRIGIGLLRVIGVEMAAVNKTTVELNKDRLFVNGTYVEVKLSDTEKVVLKQLLSNKNKVVARSMIAKSLSQKSKRFNDTVIEKTVTNLKDKLSNLWVNPNNLAIVEDRGYIYRDTL